MKNIVAFGGSTSKNSINKKLASYTATLLKECTHTVLDLNDYKVPIYSVDEEIEKGFSEDIERLNSEFEKADGFIISLAEHNGSYTAAFKNLLDWLSRKEYKLFRNKPVLLLATSPGKRGGASVLNLGITSFPHLGAKVTGSFSLPSFNENFKDNKVINETFINELVALVGEFEKEV